MKVQSFFTELRYQLADIQALAYPDDLLLEWLNDGLCLIQQTLPQLFAQFRVMPAREGSVQDLCAGCSHLLSVDGLTDECGGSLPYDVCGNSHLIRQGSISMARGYDKKGTRRAARTVQIHPEAPQQFSVYPPIAANEKLYFHLTCSVPPEPVQGVDDDLSDCRFHEALFNYLLYRAYLIEMDSASSQALSAQAFQRFWTLLGVEQKPFKNQGEA